MGKEKNKQKTFIMKQNKQNKNKQNNQSIKIKQNKNQIIKN